LHLLLFLLQSLFFENAHSSLAGAAEQTAAATIDSSSGSETLRKKRSFIVRMEIQSVNKIMSLACRAAWVSCHPIISGALDGAAMERAFLPYQKI